VDGRNRIYRVNRPNWNIMDWDYRTNWSDGFYRTNGSNWSNWCVGFHGTNWTNWVLRCNGSNRHYRSNGMDWMDWKDWSNRTYTYRSYRTRGNW